MAEKKATGKEKTKKDAVENKEKQQVKVEKKEQKKETKKTAPAKKVEQKEKKEEAPKAEKKKSTYRLSQSAYAKKRAKRKTSLEKKKPKFKRVNALRMKRVDDIWRAPTGIDSNQRMQHGSKPRLPRSGYKTPGEVRWIHPSGYTPIRVFNLKEIEKVDKDKEAIIIASSVGKRKRTEIQNAAKTKGIQILNFHDV